MQRLSRLCRHSSTARNTVRVNSSLNGAKQESPLRRLLDDASSFGEAETVAVEPELRWATQPYAARTTGERDARERAQPGAGTVLLFPGHGAHFVGMGRRVLHVPAARDLYEFASSVLGLVSVAYRYFLNMRKLILQMFSVADVMSAVLFKWDVRRVCVEGPSAELARRAHTALLVTALAALERARDERPGALDTVRAAAGFSLGELGALVFAGALDLERALRLAELRAAAESAAAAERSGAALALWLTPDAELPHALLRAREHAAARGVMEPVCQVAHYLRPGHKVVAGDEEALRFLEREGGKFGVRRATRLETGAAHSALMARAAEAMREALRSVEVRAPRVAVWSGTEARQYRDAGDVRRALARQVARPLRWEQTLQALYARRRGAHFPLTLALGPGAALRRSLRHVNARAWDCSVLVEV